IKLEDIEIDRTRPLGRGGFSEVFRGRYRGSPVAVKMLNDMQGDDAAARSFMSEMRIWADLAPCDYVAPLVGYRTDPAFLVTVLYEGGNLSAFLASRNWDRALAVKLLGEAARGLAHLHAGGILHGDVKGENVLVDLASGVPEARVADFGLAKTRTTVLDTVGNRAYQYRGAHGYTLAFAAPEVFEGQDGAKASDVWAFGMTVYQAFAAGKQPYWTVKSIPAITMAIVSGKHPTRLPGMTDDVWDVMVRCWSLDPAARPTMAEVVGMWEREVRS
ncbi:kinase-like domain-containing protein, partial [Hyaloraphidium curvatum]